MKTPRIFFLVSGLGFGNSTRTLAIIEELRRYNNPLEIYVFSWGRGLSFLTSQAKNLDFKLIPLLPYRLPLPLSSYFFNMLFAILTFFIFYPLNSLRVFFYFLIFKPRLLIFDSDYHFFSAMPFRIPRIFLGQALGVIRRGAPFSSKGFWFSKTLENLDGWVQRHGYHGVIVPTLGGKSKPPGKIHLEVSVLVRTSFHSLPPILTPSQGPIALLSGSGIGARELKEFCQLNHIPVLENEMNVKDVLMKHNPLIIQGGLSSLAEGLALGKTLLVMPLKGHWEQHLNALEVEKLGRGFHISNLKELAELLQKKDAHRLHPPMKATGAREAADALLQRLNF